MRLVPAAVTGWAVTATGILWPVGGAVAAMCVLAALGAALARARATTDGGRAVSTGLIAVAVVGVGFGMAIMLRANGVRDHPIGQLFGAAAVVTVTPTESPRAVGTGRLMVKADLEWVDEHETSGQVVVFASAQGFAAVTAGQPIRFTARVSRPTRRDLSVAVLTATGAPAMGQASAVQRFAASVRGRFAAAARDVLPAGQAAMLPALVLGDTSAMTAPVVAEYRAAGLTHLTAVSGANVTIVCGAVLMAAYLVGPRAAVGLAALALIAFVIVVQPTASVLRAAVMGAVTLLAILSSRRRQAIPALSATVLVLMIIAPQLAVDVGFALSVSATAALVLIAPVWSRRLVARGWPKPLADAIGVASAAQLVTAPLVAGISGTFSLVAVIANLAVAAVVAPITVLGTAAAALGLVWPGAADLLIRFTGPELWWLGAVAHRAAGVPNATVPVPSGGVGVLTVAFAGLTVVVLWRWRWFRRAVLCVVVCLLAWSLSALVAGHGATVSADRGTIVA
ncbi:MAG: ComEC/Rec2 family competence protein [Mycobacterium sp.]